MKSLLELIGVEEFEQAATRAVRRAARETLASGGSYVGLLNGKLVRVSRGLKGSKTITRVRERRP
jgi:hypothetical protein